MGAHRDCYFIAEQPAPAPHLAHSEGRAALRVVLVTVPRVSRSCEHFSDGFDLHLLQWGRTHGVKPWWCEQRGDGVFITGRTHHVFSGAAAERSGNTLKYFRDFYLKATTRMRS